MRLREVVDTVSAVRATRSRNRKRDALAALLGSAPAADRSVVVRWLCSQLPQGKVGVGFSMISGLWRRFEEVEATGEPLEVAEIDEAFSAVKAVKGQGSKARKEALLAGLMERAGPDERRFLGGLLVGEMRQGALDGVMCEAVALAAEVDAGLVRRAFMLSGDLAEVTLAGLSGGAAALEAFRLEHFRPLKPMLASPCETPEEALEALGTAILDWKLDGVRVQVHRSGDRVRVYTRRLHDVTPMVPELVEQALALPCTSCVLDGETLHLRADGTPAPFQVSMRRLGRKVDVPRLVDQLPLTTLYFDVLEIDGEALIDRPCSERQARLEALVGTEAVVPRLATSSADEAAAFFEAALEAGHEGLVAKHPDSLYEAGKRGSAWYKLKVAHTLDLVVLAADWGSGRRRGWLSNLHLGARDPETGGFVMLGKTFKGMTDEVLAWQTEALQRIEVERGRWTVEVEPRLVVEVAFNEVQTSPHYPGGVALRFARLRRYRPDKSADDADTIDTVRSFVRS